MKTSPSQVNTKTARISNEALNLLKAWSYLMGTSVSMELDRLLYEHCINLEIGELKEEQIALVKSVTEYREKRKVEMGLKDA
jgi:hypothetical protein